MEVPQGCKRQKLIEESHKTNGLLLSKALSDFPDRRARPVWSWPQRDKLSSNWLLALPGPSGGLTSSQFTEAAAALLFLTSPSCSDKVGQRVGNYSVDVYG